MPLPACSSILNLAYFENLASQISAVGTAEELQALVNRNYAQLGQLEGNMASQIALLTPLVALATPPSSPTEVITWIGDFITGFLTPYIKPLTTFTDQLVAIDAQVVTLDALIASVAASKFPDVVITIPPVVPSCAL